MKILAFDTSNSGLSAAILENDILLEGLSMTDRKKLMYFLEVVEKNIEVELIKIDGEE